MVESLLIAGIETGITSLFGEDDRKEMSFDLWKEHLDIENNPHAKEFYEWVKSNNAMKYVSDFKRDFKEWAASYAQKMWRATGNKKYDNGSGLGYPWTYSGFLEFLATGYPKDKNNNNYTPSVNPDMNYEVLNTGGYNPLIIGGLVLGGVYMFNKNKNRR